jgi:hypothetical protein
VAEAQVDRPISLRLTVVTPSVGDGTIVEHEKFLPSTLGTGDAEGQPPGQKGFRVGEPSRSVRPNTEIPS